VKVAGGRFVEMASVATTLIVTVADFVESLTEVAVTLAENALETMVGALYLADVAARALSVPVPEERPHVTPLGSLVVTVRAADRPPEIAVGLAIALTVIAGPIVIVVI
jgi:hypothetical protein